MTNATGNTTEATQVRTGLWVLQYLAAAGFLFNAFGKFTGYPDMMVVFVAMGTAGWLPYVIGVLEVAGAVALVVPRLRLYGLAALAFVALTVGGLMSHVIWGGSMIPAAVLLVISAVIAWGRRANTVDTIARFRR